MKRITIKVGSAYFIDEKGNVSYEKIEQLVNSISKLRKKGVEVCLVTSGAIAVGLKKMSLLQKPKETAKKQALAAIGQMTLMQLYEQAFEKYNLKCAQILVSHDDFGKRKRQNLLMAMTKELFDYGVIPVVNENDAVATAEIKVGDNDTLSAMFSLVIQSSLLVLVSDVDGLYTANPNEVADAEFIERVELVDENVFKLAKGSSTAYGTGGMYTKIKAAEICTTAGVPMMIVNSTKVSQLEKLAEGKNLGTYFEPHKNAQPLKKCWMRFCANVSAQIEIDLGATEAIIKRKSLLTCGVVGVDGIFKARSVVSIMHNGKEIARGIAHLSSEQLREHLEKGESTTLVHANDIIRCD